jgi:SagB-type dehydrogenase family enzyme
MIKMLLEVGDNFQKQTKYERGTLGGRLDWLNKPETYKAYPSKKQIPLPTQFEEQTLSFIEVIKSRRSVRSYLSKPLRISDLSFLLWASTGIQRKQRGYEFRTAPSAGALYPIETYLIVNDVEGLDKGIYHYNIAKHSLEELRTGAFGEKIAHAALEQEMCAEAPAVFVWTTIFNRSKWKYKQRAYRYVYLDAGHVAQNLALSATSIGLGSCQIGALFDDEINSIIGVDGTEESTIYLSVVGHPKTS